MLTDEQLRKLRSETAPWQRNQRPASKAQQQYIADLIQTRVVPESWLLSIKNYVDTGTLTSTKASQIIDELKKLERKPGKGQVDDRVDLHNVPSGYYAVRFAKSKHENDIVFYRVKVSQKDPLKGWVRIIFGPDEGELNRTRATGAINRIKNFGIGASAILYGRKIGCCSQCNRRLTNRISRELGIGPKCGGRVFGDDWQDRVTEARQDIIERGEDPNEPVEVPEEAQQANQAADR